MEVNSVIKSILTKKKISFSILTIATLVLSSCSNNINLPTYNNDTTINLNISDSKGASIPFKISLNKFSIKDNANGIPTSFEAVDHYLIYLIKNDSTTSYPLNGDPIGTDRVSGPFVLNAKGSSSRNFILNNVLPLSTGAYYIAIRVQDSNNQDLIKDNNGSVTAWTGSTSSVKGVAVSSGAGIQINSELVVSSTTPLSLTANLKDGQGAKIESNINPAHGSINPTSVYGNTTISTIAGNGSYGDSGDNGLATSAQLNYSWSGLTTDSIGNIYVSTDGKIKKVSPSGIISTFAGGGVDTSDDINAKLAQIDPSGLVTDSKGNLYFSDVSSGAIKKISSDGLITSLPVVLFEPKGLAIYGNYLYVVDKTDQYIYKVDLSTYFSEIIAGNPTGSSANDIPATDALLTSPESIALDSTGNIYFTDSTDGIIRKIDSSTSKITTIAGGGTSTLDNISSIQASLISPDGIVIDSSNNIYFADTGTKKIRKISASGIITTVAGNGNAYSFVEDNYALDEAIGTPSALTIDSSGNLYFQDTDSNRVRKVIF